jgi:sterol desaturase/sphingolipid hydroxylase (fatty acid hydroxylase superfamily)
MYHSTEYLTICETARMQELSLLLLSKEPQLRLGIFLGILAIMALAELLSPRRRREIPRLLRWSNNLALVAIDTLAVRLIFPVAALGLALIAQQQDFGVFNWLNLPSWLAFVLGLILLDLAIYAQHVVFHHVPVLWRLHRMHHADLEIDVTTGLRFHPFEIILSMAIKMALVAALGIPAITVLLFEIILNATSLFNHSNVALPQSIDRVLRMILVTPDMHRVHHSTIPAETNSNFGFNIPWWDRLFGTYRSQPALGHDNMNIGINQFRTRRDLWLDRLLLQPFRTVDPETQNIEKNAV